MIKANILSIPFSMTRKLFLIKPLIMMFREVKILSIRKNFNPLKNLVVVLAMDLIRKIYIKMTHKLINKLFSREIRKKLMLDVAGVKTTPHAIFFEFYFRPFSLYYLISFCF
jgi:hypothetical protein